MFYIYIFNAPDAKVKAHEELPLNSVFIRLREINPELILKSLNTLKYFADLVQMRQLIVYGGKGMKSYFGCRLGLVLLVVLLLLATFPMTGFAQSPHLVVNTHRLNIRSGPGVGYHIITSVPGGTELPVTAIDSGRLWFQITSLAGPGWVNSHYTVDRGNFAGVPILDVRGANEPALAPSQAHLVVNTGNLNVRSGPGVSHNIILTVPGGTKLPVISIGSDNLWYEVNSAAGPGWVNSYYTVTRGNFSSLRTVTLLDPPSAVLSGPTPRCVVNTHRLNIRTGPGVGYDIITSVPGGSNLAVLGRNNRGWYFVEGSFGQGWLNNHYVVFRGDFSQVPVIS